VWATVPELGFIGSFTATFSNDPSVAHAIEKSAPVLLIGGGMFLLFLFFHWLFLEQKHFGWRWVESFFVRQGAWFYATISVVLAVVVWYALKIGPMLGFGAVIGSTAFFITHGFRQHAEAVEHDLEKGKNNLSDLSKVFFLEIIDLSFSIDGVLGAFAFTLSVPLILLGNGVGAIIVRQLTVANVDRVKGYLYLKNGAMYSIAILGAVMIADAFGADIPKWFSPLSTVAVVGYFFWKSLRSIPPMAPKHACPVD